MFQNVAVAVCVEKDLLAVVNMSMSVLILISLAYEHYIYL